MVKPEGLKDLNINVINGIHMYNAKYLSNLLHVQYKTASQVISKFQITGTVQHRNAKCQSQRKKEL